MTFEDHSVLEEFVQKQATRTLPRKAFRGRTLYQSQNDFGPVRDRSSLLKMSPKLADFGLAHDGSRQGPFINPIQPDRYHAPEVLLGTGWTYSADIWNYAILVWDLLTGRTLFWDHQADSKPYSAARHLGDMIGLLGPVPRELVQKEREMRHWTWMPQALNAEGKLCDTVVDFYGGPFFAEDGTFRSMHEVVRLRGWTDDE